MIKKHFIACFFLAVILVPVSVYGLVKWYQNKYDRLPVLGKPGHMISDYQLKDQFGKMSHTAEWKDQVVVASVFFTHCPVVCPKMTRNLLQVQRSIPKDLIRIVSLTVDPERDSPARLKEYAAQFGIGTNWQLLTGSKPEIYRFARKDLQVVATDGDGGEQDFIHSEKLVLIDREKRIRGYYTGTDKKETADLIRDIKKLQREYN